MVTWDKVALSFKHSVSMRGLIDSDNQVQHLDFPCGSLKLDGYVSTGRRRSEGDYVTPEKQLLRLAEAGEPRLVFHVGEGVCG